MTNEKMLEKMYELFNIMEDGEYVKEVVVKGIIDSLKEDIRIECQKKKGNGKREAILRKLMKNASSHGFKNGLGDHFVPVEDKFGFCDGYRAYVLNEDFGYSKIAVGNYIDLNRSKPANANVKIEVDLADLAAYIKDEKAKKYVARSRSLRLKPYVLKSGDFEVAFNPEYLLDFCNMFKTDYVMCDSPLSPALYEADNGEWGLLLPVRVYYKDV